MGRHVLDSPLDAEGDKSWDEDLFGRTIPHHREDVEPHRCHFCGIWTANGWDSRGDRHWLSDCRPDLVEHVPGEKCTWPLTGDPMLDIQVGRPWCYAYQNKETNVWENEHIHFHKDGPL